MSLSPAPVSGSQDDDRTRAGTVTKVARNTAWQTLGEVVSRLGTLVFYIAMARHLGKHGFGDFQFALAVVIIVTFAGFGTDFAVMREVAKEPDQIHALFWNSNMIKITMGGFGIAIAVGFGVLGHYDHQTVIVIAVLAVAALADTLARSAQAVFRGLEDMAPIALSLIMQRLFLATIGIAALSLGTGLIGSSVIYLLASCVGLAWVTSSLLRRGIRPRFSVSYPALRALVTDSLSAALGIVFITVLARFDTVILSALKGNTAVGVYSAGYRLFEAATLLSVVFGQAVYPVFARLGKLTVPSVAGAYETTMKAVTVALFPLSCVCVLFAASIVQVVYGHELAAAAKPLQLLGPAIWLWGVFLVSMLALAAQNHQRLVAQCLAFGAVVNVALNFALIPGSSYRGAATAMGLSMLVLSALLVSVAVRKMGCTLSVARVCAGPALGVITMILIVFVLGNSIEVIPVVLFAYAIITSGVDKVLWPQDWQLVSQALSRVTAT